LAQKHVVDNALNSSVAKLFVSYWERSSFQGSVFDAKNIHTFLQGRSWHQLQCK